MNLPVTVFDDGSLTAHDAKYLKSQFLNIQVISSATAAKKMARLLSSYSYCRQFRFSPHPYTHHRKLLDCVLLPTAKRLLLLDADMLFFSPPTEIVEWVNSSSRTIYYVTDHRKEVEDDMGLLTVKVLAKLWKLPIAPPFNSGIIAMQKKDFDLRKVNAFLKEIYHLSLEDTWFVEQLTFVKVFTELNRLAMQNGHKKLAVPLHPLKYAVLTALSLRNNVWERVCIHYNADKKEYLYPDSVKLLMRTKLFRRIAH